MRKRSVLILLQAAVLMTPVFVCGTGIVRAEENAVSEQTFIPLLEEDEKPVMTHTIHFSEEQLHRGCLVLVNPDYAFDFDANSGMQLERLVDAQTYPFIVEKEEFCLCAEIISSLSEMIRDCDEAMGSETTSVSSAWRSKEYQQNVWDTYEELYGESYCQEYVAVPGFSEHHTGLAADLGIIYEDGSEGTFSESENAVWMAANSWRYGFIRRYAEDKVSVTGISNEAWHFRYVGQPHAWYMVEHNLCLEEYLEMLRNETSPAHPLEMEYGGKAYTVFHTSRSEIEEPEGDYTVSGDNISGYVITVQ